MDQLTAVTAVDGRYHSQTAELSAFWSESALIGYRVRVESAWLLALAEPLGLKITSVAKARLQEWREGEGVDSAAIKAIEQKTNHDVKAVEYWMQSLPTELHPFIHFACTSEDINNLAYALMLKDFRDKLLLPTLDQLLSCLATLASNYKNLSMLSRTHGQPATPTTLGKELANFAHRISKLRDRISYVKIEGKINGAVGNYNAHVSACPDIDWYSFSEEFVEDHLDLSWNPLTTQIENHDSLVEFLAATQHVSQVMIGLARDMWMYISINYFTQKTVATEVGSSTMPHKVNPIDFENAEGNFGLACGMMGHLIDKLPISRWQRDLSDSTTLRSLGTVFGHFLIGCKALQRGLGKVEANVATISSDLDGHWEVLGEAVQTVLRRHGVSNAYERLKEATRGQGPFSETSYKQFVNSLSDIPQDAKERLLKLKPETYTGLAEIIVDQWLEKMELP
jgi:adenylosuccinate lyase